MNNSNNIAERIRRWHEREERQRQRRRSRNNEQNNNGSSPLLSINGGSNILIVSQTLFDSTQNFYQNPPSPPSQEAHYQAYMNVENPNLSSPARPVVRERYFRESSPEEKKEEPIENDQESTACSFNTCVIL